MYTISFRAHWIIFLNNKTKGPTSSESRRVEFHALDENEVGGRTMPGFDYCSQHNISYVVQSHAMSLGLLLPLLKIETH